MEMAALGVMSTTSAISRHQSFSDTLSAVGLNSRHPALPGLEEHPEGRERSDTMSSGYSLSSQGTALSSMTELEVDHAPPRAQRLVPTRRQSMPNLSHTMTSTSISAIQEGHGRLGLGQRSPLARIKGIAGMGSDRSLPGKLSARSPGLDRIQTLLDQADGQLSQVALQGRCAKRV